MTRKHEDHAAHEALEEHRFPCNTCGSDMRFDPAEGMLVCDHCGNREPIDGGSSLEHALVELDFDKALGADLPRAEMQDARYVTCPNCGARIEIDGPDHAIECPFCATPIVADSGAARQIKPRALLPFAKTERQARKAMTDWLGKLWFAPNGLQEYARKGRRMHGIYVPYWTYDADTKSRYTGERGTIYYVTRTVRRDGKNVSVREQRVRWTPTSGRVARFFDDILVLASISLPKKYTDGLQPWDLSQLVPYNPEYLAGFGAEGYTVDLKDGFTEARAYMDQMIRRDVRFDIGGDRQRILTLQTKVSDVTFKHILLPVWMAAYKYRGKTYRFVVNGRTGRVQGERPWSRWKIAFAIAVGLILAAVAGYIYSYYTVN